MANNMAVWLALETSSFSFAPKYWEIIIVAPDERPIKKLTGNLWKLITDSMAAKASLPANFPTMMASIVV